MFPTGSSLLLLAVSTLSKLVNASPQHARDVQSPYAHSSQSIELKAIKHVASESFKHAAPLRARSNQQTAPSNETIHVLGRAPLFAAPVTIGFQTFNLLIDTGSADTWVADSYFSCMMEYRAYPASQSYCALNSTFVHDDDGPSDSVTSATNSSFFVRYADGSYVGGPLRTTYVSLTSDVAFPQLVGFASSVAFTGGNLTSGILGLAYSSLTSQYPGTDYWNSIPCPLESPGNDDSPANPDVRCKQRNYVGVMQNLISLDSLRDRRYFALALSRDSSNNSDGGLLTFGGTPDYYDPKVNLSSSFVSTPIRPLAYDSTNITRFYTISVEGFTFPAFTNYSTSTTSSYSYSNTNAPSTHKPLRRTTTNQAHTMSQADGKSQFIVDSGTEITTIPSLYAATFNALFDPPAYQEYSGGPWYLNCTTLSFVPPFGITIAGQTFYHNPEDLVIRKPSREYDYVLEEYVETEVCFSAIQDAEEVGGGYTNNVLGQPTLKNVLVVFDVGASKMGFAARPYYES